MQLSCEVPCSSPVSGPASIQFDTHRVSRRIDVLVRPLEEGRFEGPELELPQDLLGMLAKHVAGPSLACLVEQG